MNIMSSLQNMDSSQFRAKALNHKPMAHPGLKPGVSVVSLSERPHPQDFNLGFALMSRDCPQAGHGSKISLTPGFSLGTEMLLAWGLRG